MSLQSSEVDTGVTKGKAVARQDPQPAQSTSPAAVDNDGDDQDIPPLPRTKSQLSLMIESERQKSGSYELPSSPVAAMRPCDNQAKPPQEDDENEGDLLMMGRRDGVTKAGGVSEEVRRKQRLGNGSDVDRTAYQSPPTSPLY